MHTLFIADLHLSPSTPLLNQGFFDLLQSQAATTADAVYILGDLFEFWGGDDDNSEFANSIRAKLKTLTDSGVPCYFIFGNRDFLVGQKFSKQTGVALLDEETVIDLYGTPTLIMHGDTLCTDDHQYLAFREKVQQKWLQVLFLAIPRFIRQKIITNVQSKAKQTKQDKSLSIMDVNQAAVLNVMHKHQVTQLVHGHTHRPNTHTYQVKGQTLTRYVLGDWGSHAYLLFCEPTGFSVQKLAL